MYSMLTILCFIAFITTRMYYKNTNPLIPAHVQVIEMYYKLRW